MSVISIDIDAQRAFSALCPKELPVEGATEIVVELNAQAELADFRVLTRDGHGARAVWIVPDHTQMVQPLNFPNANLTWVRHAEVGTDGFLPLPGLPAPADYDFLAIKGCDDDMHPFGICYQDLAERISTGLIEWLQARDAKVLLVGGLATDYCVKASVLQLCRAGGWKVLLNTAACRGIAEETTRTALEEMREAGAILLENAQAVRDWLAENPQ